MPRPAPKLADQHLRMMQYAKLDQRLTEQSKAFDLFPSASVLQAVESIINRVKAEGIK